MKKFILPLFLSLAVAAPFSTAFASDTDREIAALEEEIKQLKLKKLRAERDRLLGDTQQPLDSSSEQSYEDSNAEMPVPQTFTKEKDDLVQENETSTGYNVPSSTTQQTTISVNEIVFPQEWRVAEKFSAILSKEIALPGILDQLNIKIDQNPYNRTQSCLAQVGQSTPGHINNAGRDSFLLFTATMNGGQQYHKYDGTQYIAELLLGGIVTKEDLANMGYGIYFSQIKEKIQQIQKNKREKRFRNTIENIISQFN